MFGSLPKAMACLRGSFSVVFSRETKCQPSHIKIYTRKDTTGSGGVENDLGVVIKNKEHWL
jgi:hypothetical protein